MKAIITIIMLVVGVIYYPLNMLYLAVQKWYLPMQKEDKVIFFAFAPFYWLLVGIVFAISYPYEKLSEFVGH